MCGGSDQRPPSIDTICWVFPLVASDGLALRIVGYPARMDRRMRRGHHLRAAVQRWLTA
jgi:hypothetical protein